MFTVWFTGLSGAGKTTLSTSLYEEVIKKGLQAELLDGDIIRNNFAQDLTFTREHRDINVKRMGFVSKLLNKHGVVSIVAMIAPYKEVREQNRELIENYIEVFVDCPIDILKTRDPKGLYEKARKGIIKNFTGVSDPYERHEYSDIVVKTDRESVKESLINILNVLEVRGLI